MMSRGLLSNIRFIEARVFGTQRHVHSAHPLESANITHESLLAERSVHPETKFAEPDFAIVCTNITEDLIELGRRIDRARHASFLDD